MTFVTKSTNPKRASRILDLATVEILVRNKTYESKMVANVGRVRLTSFVLALVTYVTYKGLDSREVSKPRTSIGSRGFC